MIGASERLTAEFFRWEARGRGYDLWPQPVVPEPVFDPFRGHGVADDSASPDDGRKTTFLSSLVRKISTKLAPPPEGNAEEKVCDEAEPETLIRSDLVELQAHIPEGMRFDRGAWVNFFSSVAVSAKPAVFEIICSRGRITVEFVVHERDERLFRRQLEAFFPDAVFASNRGFLEEAWGEADAPVAAVEFGLGKEFMIPLAQTRSDPFVGLVGALSEIEDNEIAVFQVLFSPATYPWDESIMRSVTHADGNAFFVNAPELLSGAQEKVALPLYAAVVRVAVKASSHERMWEIACNVAGALGAYGSKRGNELVPLKNDGYPGAEHEEDVLRRQSRRSGMLLNADELAGFVHIPSGEVKSTRLRPNTGKTKAMPPALRNREGVSFGTNVHFGSEAPVILTNDERVRHVHVIGASGTGKSTLLFNLIRQDMENGEGLTVIEPHGDLIDRVLSVVPEHRIQDVVLLDPSDEEHTVGFNILSAHSDWEKSLLASDLVAVFRRNSTSWGDQLNSVLQNAILAFLESEQGGTLLELRRFLLESSFRNEFLKTVRDDNLLYYWRHGFPALTGNKSVGSIVTRLDAFLSPKPLRYMVAQKANRLDLGDIMGAGKIFLAKLSQGAIGPDNSRLLGSLLVAKIQSEAVSRQRQSEASRRDHFLYIDEFHDFLTPSLAETLSGVRKYRLGLTLSHQEMRQVEREPDVASALLSNAYTRVVFRVGDRDARTLEGGFSSFDARDLQNLGTGRAVCRVERSDNDFSLVVAPPAYPDQSSAQARRETVVESSRKRYATPRAEVERMLSQTVVAADVPLPVAAPAPSVPTAPTPRPPKIIPPVPIKESRESGEPAVLPDLGRGGAQHKAIQDRIKQAAEKLGFRVIVEKEVLDGAGSVDLVLSRDDAAIACEVTVTTTIDHEVGNVAKCLKAGFTRVVLIAPNADKLNKLASAVSNSIGPEKAACVGYFLPDAFITLLGKSSLAVPALAPEVRSKGGRVIKRTFTVVDSEEAKRKESEALKLMRGIMRVGK